MAQRGWGVLSLGLQWDGARESSQGLGWRKRPRKRSPGRAGDTAGHVTAGEASPAEVGCLSDPLLPEPAAGTIWLQQAC